MTNQENKSSNKVAKVAKVGVIIIFLLMTVIIITIQIKKDKILTDVSFADATAPYSAPIYVAVNNGYFIDEELNVNISTFTAGRLAVESLLGGKADFAMVADMPIMRIGLSNQKIAIISTIAQSNNAIKFIARKDVISEPKDIKGKRVGTFFGTSSEYFLSVYLKTIGINDHEIIKVNVSPPNMPYALIQGDLDTYDIWQPHIQNAQDVLKEDAYVFGDSTIYTLTWNILTNPDFLKNNYDVAKRLLKAVLKAQDFINQNRTESIEITANAIGMQVEALDRIWDDYNFGNTLNQTLIDVITDEAKWVLESDESLKISQLPNYRSFIYENILKQLKPESVQLNN